MSFRACNVLSPPPGKAMITPNFIATSSRGNPVQFEEWEQIGQQNVMLFTNREQLCISGKLDPATKGPCSVPRSLRLPVVGSTPAHGGSRPRGPSPSKPEIRTIFLRRNKAQPVLVYESSAPAGRRWPKLRTLNIRVSPYRGLFNQIRTDFFRRASACCRTVHGMLSCPGKVPLSHATKTINPVNVSRYGCLLAGRS